MNTLLLVDGSNLLFQMFYGMPSRIVNEEGVPIQGVIGFVGALLKIIRMTSPTHIAVLFDGEHENPRKALDEDYKADRPDYSRVPEEDNPFSQLPYVKKALSVLKIPYKETISCEVDDWMAAYVTTYSCDHKIVIASFDSDFFQLISPNVSVLRYRGENSTVLTPAEIEARFGITPVEYADFKALVGDSSDNIKGIRGIGPRTASKLLKSYGSLEEIFSSLDRITPEKLCRALCEGKERLMTNRALIKLCGNCPLPFSIDELLYQPTALTTTDVLVAIGLKKR